MKDEDTQGGHRFWGTGLFLTATALVLAGGVAYACTTFKGKLGVTGSGGPGVETHADGTAGMGWCDNPIGSASVAANTSGTVAVSVGASSSGECAATTLPAGTYNVRYSTGTWSASDPSTNDCMDTTVIGTFTVSGGTGSTTSASFNPGAAGPLNICVVNSGAVNGNLAPLSIV